LVELPIVPQKRLDGQTNKVAKPEKPWEGICCKACWNGRAKWCECKCGGAYHGFGHNGHRDSEDPEMPVRTVRKYFLRRITRSTCHCGANIIGEPVHYYEDDKGWIVPGMKKRQWLYIVCPTCGDQLALWKLGVDRDPEEGQKKLQEVRA
jgi:hypothetical protein